MGRFPRDSHRNDIPMDKLRVVHGTYLYVPFPTHSNLCLSHLMGRFPWDSHRNPVPMDKSVDTIPIFLPLSIILRRGKCSTKLRVCTSSHNILTLYVHSSIRHAIHQDQGFPTFL